MSYPVGLDERVDAAEQIVLGKLVSQHSYWDEAHANIYTLNILDVTAYLKGASGATQVAVITIGGVVGNEAQVTHPALELYPWNEYVLFLRGDENFVDDKSYRDTHPGIVQAQPYADAQGALTKQGGVYHDLYAEPKQTEAALFAKIAGLSDEAALTPQGRPFSPREGDTRPLSEWAEIQSGLSRTAPITSFSPDPTNAGTINPSDFITINGSGFGGSPGTVFYANADDGGATFTSSGVASDNVSWNDSQIQNKPAGNGGTGPINVNGAMTSASALTIDYAHIEINSSFSGFGSTTRQRYHLVDKNGAGGYTFVYNTAFNANSAATAAYERAQETWRCNTGVNFDVSGTTGTATASNDGENVVLFDASLPAGVLGRATSRFLASATGACNGTNTVWWTNEIDVQFKPDPPAGCCTWNFGPGASAFNEFDFESVALHELGHAHGLGHVIASGAVMHFSISNGTDARTLNADDINGGNAKMAYSTSALCFNPSGVNGPITDISGSCSLPVTWTDLHGRHEPETGNVLEWTVSSELENAGFEVQRSQNGIDFAPVGFVSSKGNSHTEVSYRFTDGDAAIPALSFYRLLQRDKNGHTTVSEIVRIERTAAAGIEVWPTVFREQLHIRGRATGDGAMGLRILSPEGKLVHHDEIAVQPGLFSRSADLGNLPAGIYFYRIELAGNTHTGKVVKLR